MRRTWVTPVPGDLPLTFTTSSSLNNQAARWTALRSRVLWKFALQILVDNTWFEWIIWVSGFLSSCNQRNVIWAKSSGYWNEVWFVVLCVWQWLKEKLREGTKTLSSTPWGPSVYIREYVWISADVYVSAAQPPFLVNPPQPPTRLVLFCDNLMDSLVSHTALS